MAAVYSIPPSVIKIPEETTEARSEKSEQEFGKQFPFHKIPPPPLFQAVFPSFHYVVAW